MTFFHGWIGWNFDFFIFKYWKWALNRNWPSTQIHLATDIKICLVHSILPLTTTNHHYLPWFYRNFHGLNQKSNIDVWLRLTSNLYVHNLSKISWPTRNLYQHYVGRDQNLIIIIYSKMCLTSMNSFVLFQCVLLWKCSAAIAACIWPFTLILLI